MTAVLLTVILQQKPLGGTTLWALAPAGLLLLLDAHHRARERWWSQVASDFAAKLGRNGKAELRPKELVELPQPRSGFGAVPKLFVALRSLAVWPFYAGLAAAAAVVHVETTPAKPTRVLTAAKTGGCGSGGCGSAEGCGTGSCAASAGGACSCGGGHGTNSAGAAQYPIQARPMLNRGNIIPNGGRPVITMPPGKRPNNGAISNAPGVPASAVQIMPPASASSTPPNTMIPGGLGGTEPKTVPGPLPRPPAGAPTTLVVPTPNRGTPPAAATSAPGTTAPPATPAATPTPNAGAPIPPTPPPVPPAASPSPTATPPPEPQKP